MAATDTGRKGVWSWALYDWGNSAFATTVMAGFFPLFFKQYWSAGVDPQESTLRLGLANSSASILVAVAAPILGAIADRSRRKKRLLGICALLGVGMTAALYFIEQGDYPTAVLCYVLATMGWSGSIVFYDALLLGVAAEPDRDRVSAFGYALGYLGGGVLFAVNVWMTLQPQTFGLADKGVAVRVSFMMVALWWGLFSIPLLRNVHEPAAPMTEPRPRRAFWAAFVELKHTFGELRSYRPVWLFLAAYWLYIDGVDTIIRMAVDYGLSLGFSSETLITALLITQFVGFPAALLYGWLGDKIGTKNGILIGVAIYVGVTVWGYYMDQESEFFVLAVVVGLVQGGVQALSRSLYSRLIPAQKAAEFFGFYNMLGKFAAVIGPALMGLVSMLTGSSRLSLLSVALLLIGGGLLLWKVPTPEPNARRV